MTSFLKSDRSRAVAVWLFAVAALVLAMVVVGGATRLTDSGLSITQWKPVTGALPPMNLADWQAEFDRYRDIPQYKLVNPNMDLAQFKTIYWWEWSHRLLGGLEGAVGWWMVASGLADRVSVAPERLMIHLGLAFALLGALVWTALDA